MSDSVELEQYFDRLWPLLRSITGNGVRETHNILNELVPLHRYEIPSGQDVLDWTIPKEWNVRNAYVIDPNGKRRWDVWENNLHLVNYSVPFQGELHREELDRHLHSLEDMPAAIPYVTSYYRETWGFCLSHEERLSLPEGKYQVVIDTELSDGSLTLSDTVFPGTTSKEVLFHTYTCHPSLAINELSGPLVTAFLARRIQNWSSHRLTYRFVFAPETIGAVSYLSLHGDHLKEHLNAGYIVTCVGDNAPLHYKGTKSPNSLTDRAAKYVLGDQAQYRPFIPSGSDERQYSSIGYMLPVGSLNRTPYAAYPEYHTSFDNKSVLDFDAMNQTVDIYEEICLTIERNLTLKNIKPYGEPQLSKVVDFYGTLDKRIATDKTKAAKWCVHYCDGTHDLLSIAQMSGLELKLVHDTALELVQAGLLELIP